MVPGVRRFLTLFVLVYSACLTYAILTTERPFDAPAPRVHVRWTAEVTAEERAMLEARYRLTDPVYLDSEHNEVTGAYSILDTSSAHLRALVRDPAVADTHAIDRGRFVIADDAMRSGLFPGFLLTAALISFPIAWFASWFARDSSGGIGAFVTRGIPAISAEALGFFRVFYAAFLFRGLIARRLDAADALLDGPRSFSWAWVDWLASRPDAIRSLEDVILVLLVLFGVGLFARVTYTLVAAGLTVWTIVVLVPQSVNIHVWEVAFLMVLCLLPVPWGAAFSLDESIRRWRGVSAAPPRAGRRYGFAFWLPGFLLGAVWMGAAYSKVESGFGWILGGMVKYHWVIDADQAPVDWGLWVASHHWVAVLMSFLGVLLEATFILAAFARTPRARVVLATSIGVPLLLGFYLFHGVLWWTWGLALTSFVLPWQAIFNAVVRRVPRVTCAVDVSDPKDRRRVRFWHGLDWLDRIRFVDVRDHGHAGDRALAAGRGWTLALVPSIPLLWPALVVAWPLSALRARRHGPVPGVQTARTAPTSEAAPADRETHGLQPVHAGIVCVICLLMVTELPEGFGRFTSYSNSYESTADFDRRHPTPPVDTLWIRYGTPDAVRVPGRARRVIDAVARLRRGETVPSTSMAAIGRLRERLVRAYGEDGHVVTAVRTPRFFDWEHGRFAEREREVLGTMDLDRVAPVPEDRRHGKS